MLLSSPVRRILCFREPVGIRNYRSKHARAARFIYLNRACWNGLYRVNRNGRFNVPIGTRQSAVFDSDDSQTASKALRRARIVCVDFEHVIDQAGERDFVFVDLGGTDTLR